MSGPKAATRVSIWAAMATSSLAKNAPTRGTERSTSAMAADTTTTAIGSVAALAPVSVASCEQPAAIVVTIASARTRIIAVLR